jgi:hypothetical protein
VLATDVTEFGIICANNAENTEVKMQFIANYWHLSDITHPKVEGFKK